MNLRLSMAAACAACALAGPALAQEPEQDERTVAERLETLEAAVARLETRLDLSSALAGPQERAAEGARVDALEREVERLVMELQRLQREIDTATREAVQARREAAAAQQAARSAGRAGR